MRGTHLGPSSLNPILYQSAPRPRYQTVRGPATLMNLVETFGEVGATEKHLPDCTGPATLKLDPENTSRKPVLFNSMGYKSLVTTNLYIAYRLLHVLPRRVSLTLTTHPCVGTRLNRQYSYTATAFWCCM